MKRRILVLLLAVCCMLSLASCFKDTPQSLYENAKEALAEVTRYEAKITTISTTKYGSEQPTTDQIVMDLKVDGNNMQMTVDGETVLYVDGMMYLAAGDEKIKVAVSAENLEKNLGMQTDASDMPELSKEMLKDVELVENGENRTFTVTLDEQTLKNYMGSSLDNMTEDAEVTFSNATFTATFDKDDNLVKMSVKFDMALSLGELGSMSMTTESIIEFVKIGDDLPAITAPADAASYEEISSDMIFG